MPGTVARTIEGKTYLFPRITPRQAMALTTTAFAQRREAVLRDLNESGADAESRLSALNKLQELEGTNDLLLSHAKSVHGSAEIVSLSSEKLNGNKPTDEALASLDRLQFFHLAAELCGFVVKEGDSADDNDGFDRPTSGGKELSGSQ